MAKVLLVEDDNNLREIYEARLQAEGYEIISARDGEEALVVAKNELPDLVISDVMMPKISGFEMLDILRNTEGLKDVKVIMLTALGQAEDQTRADSLGADRYLVKSQVTLEDIVNAAQQLLTGGDDAAAAVEPAAAPAEPAPVAEPVAPAVPTESVAPATEPVEAPAVIPVASAPSEELAPVNTPDVAVAPEEPVAAPEAPAAAVEPAAAPAEPAPVAEPVAPAVPTESVAPASDTPQTQAEEQATVEQQIESFVQSQPGTPPPAADPVATDAVTTEPETTTSEQEQALNDAVTSLSGNGTDTTDAPAAPEDTEVSEEAGTTTHKKVIVPITDAEEPKKSLDELLAEETAKEEATTPAEPAPAPEAPVESPAPAAPTPQPAAPVAAPQQPQAPAPQQQANKNDFDPNSIAL